MALAVVSWLWGNKYDAIDAGKLVDSVRRNLRQHHRFLIFTDQELRGLPKDVEIHEIKDQNSSMMDRSCFCRLRIFDRATQAQLGLKDRIACIDLDAVITAQIDDLFNNNEDFMILKGANSSNPNPFNCSVMMLKAGKHHEVWDDFTLEKANSVPYYEFPDDQGWIWHKLPGANGWKCGVSSGIYAFQKPGWPSVTLRDTLPSNAKIVCFVGSKKPHQYVDRINWLDRHWRLGR